MFLAAPLLGALFAIFLPAVGFVLLGEAIFRRLRPQKENRWL
jgi:hypothetical protein